MSSLRRVASTHADGDEVGSANVYVGERDEMMKITECECVNARCEESTEEKGKEPPVTCSDSENFLRAINCE